MMRAAADGKYVPPLSTDHPEMQFSDEPKIGEIENGRYPSPNTDSARAARPELSNEIPSLRGRHIRAAKKRREKAAVTTGVPS
jgi:hypothetical protein